LIETADLAAFVFRLLATGGVVLGVTFAVGRMGPTAGGMLAGLPIVIGPGLVFLAIDETPGFVAETATFALLSLCATQSFMLAYLAGRAARLARLPPSRSHSSAGS
jgi:alanine dehydrogenase